MNENIIKDKSYKFSIRIIKLAKYLQSEKNEYILSKQVLRSGTSIGAMVRESEFAQSKADFISKLSIALKEANETDYWIELLKDTNYIDKNMYKSIQPEIIDIIKILVSIVKNSKKD